MKLKIFLSSFLMIAQPLYAESPRIFDLTKVYPQGTRSSIYDINIDDRYVYVPHLGVNEVIILQRDLKKVVRILKTSQSPHGAAVDAQHFLYIAGHRSGRVLKYDKKFNEISDWDKDLRSQMSAPVALTTDREGNVYIADWVALKVIKVTSDGKFLLSFDTSPIRSRDGFEPHGLEVYKDKVFVADRGTGTIQVFSVNGAYLQSWAKPTGDFDPLTVRLLAEDLFVAPNYKDGALYIFSADGQLIHKEETLGDAPGKFLHASSVVSERGFIYVSELNGSRVQKVDYRQIIQECQKKRP